MPFSTTLYIGGLAAVYTGVELAYAIESRLTERVILLPTNARSVIVERRDQCASSYSAEFESDSQLSELRIAGA